MFWAVNCFCYRGSSAVGQRRLTWTWRATRQPSSQRRLLLHLDSGYSLFMWVLKLYMKVMRNVCHVSQSSISSLTDLVDPLSSPKMIRISWIPCVIFINANSREIPRHNERAQLEKVGGACKNPQYVLMVEQFSSWPRLRRQRCCTDVQNRSFITVKHQSISIPKLVETQHWFSTWYYALSINL